MKLNSPDELRRDEMAKAVAPYVHPRFAMIPHTGDSEKPTPMVARVEFVRAIDGAHPVVTSTVNFP